ncbi:MAG: AAA family ATPase [Deltaproteobacteria bacterium]|nr:AAA family ATPase [Deltaproteobacteria bacterium]
MRPTAKPSAPDWLNPSHLQRVKAALAARTEYPEQPAPSPDAMEHVQTHISMVILTPAYAFKFKRPVNLGFADFTTLTLRRQDCQREVRLNRRLAPGVYLGVVALRFHQGEWRVGGPGRVVDYAVVMRRLPGPEMLDQRLTQSIQHPNHQDPHNLLPPALDRLARRLALFFRRARAAHPHLGGIATLRQNWQENFAQAAPQAGILFSPPQDGQIQEQVDGFLTDHRLLLEGRLTQGRICHGHGDLRAEHIHLRLPAPPGEPEARVIDCVEFTDRFRYNDSANDMAFLLMDLAHLGRPDLARRMMDTYLEAARDPQAALLIPFYACYRAYVRGKVAGFRLADPNLSPLERETLTKEGRTFFQEAWGYAQQMKPPQLLILCGAMGTGKSTLAEELARQTGMVHLNSDRIRKELAGIPTRQPHHANTPSPTAWGKGIYTPAWTAKTYREMLARAQALLALGRPVVVDASFSRRKHRQQARVMAQNLGAEWLFVECRLEEKDVLERLGQRERAANSISDGRRELYPAQKAQFEPLEEIPPKRRMRLDMAQPPAVLARQVTDHPGLGLLAPLFVPQRIHPESSPGIPKFNPDKPWGESKRITGGRD